MEPLSYLIQVAAAAAFTAMPMQPATVPGTIEMVNVSNSSVITTTAAEIVEKKTAEEKALAAAAAAKEAEEKAAKEAAEAAAGKTEDEAAKEEAAKTAQRENLHLPIKAGAYSYTSDFGLRCAPVTGAGNFHFGMDLAAPLGTPLYAIADGTVVSVIDGSSTVGGDVRIESTVNGKLMTFRYHHMGNSSQYVKAGDKIKAGHHISDVASTGLSTGPHLHLEIFEGKFSDQKHIDPEEYFTAIGLDVVGSASANYVDKHDHPTSCPGGTFTPGSTLIPAAAPAQPTQSAPVPAATRSAAPVAPAPVAPAPAPARPAPSPSAPAPSPSPVPIQVTPSPVPSVSPTAIPSLPITVPTAEATPAP